MNNKSQIISMTDYIKGGVEHLVELLLFLAVVGFAVTSITEIAARDSFLGYLDNQAQAINEELAQNASGNNGKLTEEALSHLKSNRDVYKFLKGRVEALISVGADSSKQTLISIRHDSENIEFSVPGNEGGDLRIQSVFYSAQEIINRLSSDYLLAIAIMTCGAIGAAVASIRTTRVLSWRSLLFGLAAGFIVFLAIKGGRHVFLLETQGQVMQFNPYSSGFLGLLSGMFTERSFELLSVITEAIFKKVKRIAEE